MHPDWTASLGYGTCSDTVGKGGRRLKAVERDMGESISWNSLDVGDSVDRRVIEA